MGNVVSFPDKGSGPHLEGPMKCVRCQHTWRGVAPVGLVDGFECPACHNMTGVIFGMIQPADEFWQCNCGNNLFHLDRRGAPLCCNCGLRATSWADS
jgi:hypothetical protein